MKKYPDISEIIKKKETHRRALAALSFEEKMEMVFKLQARREFVKAGQIIRHTSKRKVKRSVRKNKILFASSYRWVC